MCVPVAREMLPTLFTEKLLAAGRGGLIRWEWSNNGMNNGDCRVANGAIKVVGVKIRSGGGQEIKNIVV